MKGDAIYTTIQPSTTVTNVIIKPTLYDHYKAIIHKEIPTNEINFIKLKNFLNKKEFCW